jgi:AbrB family looped-hinge helix DNA binding protein
MAEEKVEIGTLSARGQLCIPSNIREAMKLKEGSKVLFFLNNDSLLMKRVNTQTFEELTKPLRDAHKNIKESEVSNLIHKFRTEKKSKK